MADMAVLTGVEEVRWRKDRLMWHCFGEETTRNSLKSVFDRDKPGNVVGHISVDGFEQVWYAGVFDIFLELKEDLLVGGKGRLSLKDLQDSRLETGDIIGKRGSRTNGIGLLICTP